MKMLSEAISYFWNFDRSDLILLMTFLAIVWYSWETRQLRKWQKKQAQLTLLSLHTQRQVASAEHHGRNFLPSGEDYARTVREIMEQGKFDPKLLFTPAFRDPITVGAKLWALLVRLRNRE
mgnify:CR=1